MGTRDRIGIAALLAFAITGLDRLFDWIGRSTAPEDAVVFTQRLRAIVSALNAIPWLWPVVGLALLVVWVLWPRPQTTAPPVSLAPPPQPIIVEPPKPSVQHTPLETSHVEGRGYYHEGKVWVVSPFAVNNLVVEVYGSKDIIDVSVIRSGLNSQSHDGNEERIRIKCKQPGSDVYSVLINTRSEKQPVVKYSVE